MDRSEALRQYFLQAENAILASIESLIEQETPSTNVDRLDSCAEYLHSLFAPLVDQAEIIRVPNGGNHVRVQLHAQSPKLPPILVLTRLILYNSRPHRPLRHQSVGGLQLPASCLSVNFSVGNRMPVASFGSSPTRSRRS